MCSLVSTCLLLLFSLFIIMVESVPPAAHCAALTALYDSMGGSNWVNNDGWTTNTDCCAWYGITCDASDNVTRVVLGDNGLNGALPPELGDITTMRHFDIRMATFSGTLPEEYGAWTELVEINLNMEAYGSGSLTGTWPDTYASWTNLVSYSSRYHTSFAINSEIPSWFGTFQKLEVWKCDWCKMGGELPSSFQNLYNLKVLQIADSNIINFPPDWFYSMTNLTTLYIEKLHLSTGPYPVRLGELTNLQSLYQQNTAYDPFPFPVELFNITGLAVLALSSNVQMTGSIPEDFGNRFPDMNALVLTYTGLEGPIPESFCNMTKIQQMRLGDNDFTGTFPACTAEAWPSLWLFEIPNNQFTGCLPNFTSPNLREMYVNDNQLTGTFPYTAEWPPTTLKDRCYASGNSFSCNNADDGSFANSNCDVSSCIACDANIGNPECAYPYYNVTNTAYIGGCSNKEQCKNGGFNPTGDLYQCDCSNTNHIGVYCESECKNGGYNTPFNNFTSCICLDNHITKTCAKSCNLGIANDNFTACDCDGSGSDGKYCTEDIDDCISSPCLNTGVCTDFGADLWPNHANEFNCSCEGTGYHGVTCEISDCTSSPCLNDGMCEQAYDLDGPSGIKCNCSDTGYEGDWCQTEITECASSPCLNDGICIDLLGDFTCDCTGTGNEGLTCAIDIDDCMSSPCENDGVCEDKGANNFKCTCDEFWEGNVCTEDVDDCILKGYYCENEAGCTDDPVNMGDVLCDCSASEGGFTGKYCNVPIEDACVTFNPCFHGGKCIFDDITKEMSCDCTDTGYEGDVCDVQVYVSECVSSPCLNEGQCYDPSDYQDDWYCVCVNDYFGDLCDLQACDSDPCQNGGTCTNDDDTYTCACPENYSGAQCQTNGDEQVGIGSSSSSNSVSIDPDIQSDDAATGNSGDSLPIAFIIGGVGLLCAAIGGYVWWKKQQGANKAREYIMPT